MERVDSAYLEKAIIKMMLFDKHYTAMVANAFEEKFFDSKIAGSIFGFISNYIRSYNALPEKEIILNSVDGSKAFLNEVDDIAIDLNENREWLIDQTNDYLKEKALKGAILDSVDIIEGKVKEDKSKIRELIESALIKDLKVKLGQSYWDDLTERLRMIATTNDIRIPFYYPMLDELVNGGIPARGSLSAICGATFAGKSLFAINIGCRQSLAGYTVLIYTLEMDEYSYAERADGIFSGFNINKIYLSKDGMKSLFLELKRIKNEKKPGKLIIKDFPTGKASVSDFIAHFRELQMRGINPDIVFVDYIGIMRGKYPQTPYLNIKFLAEELRAMGIMFNVPVITFHQINREGRRVPFSELSGVFVSESTALEHNCDFMAMIGIDEDAMVYENMLFLKIVKNRFGGRKGIVSFYMDSNSLKVYDETEIDQWLEDAKISGDSRKVYERYER